MGGPRTVRREAPGPVARLMASKDVVVFCGSGGVGKTTTAAAAAAMAAVHDGGKVLVLTIDPARRLADALGLGGIGNVETRVSGDAFARAGVVPRGELWAAMLDTKQSWDELVRRHAPDPATARRIFANPLYQNVSGRFVQSHDYIAMERLYELHRAGDYDLIVVDTPPSRNAIDFLEAPQRMAEFFSSRFLRLLTTPGRSRFVNMATRPFYQVADRILGSQFIEDVAEFFILFQSMYAGFVERSRSVARLLHDHRTSFVVVSTLEPAPVREAAYFVEALRQRNLHLGALALNKVLPDVLLDDRAVATAERLEATAAEVAKALPSDLGDVAQVERVLTEVAESFLRFHLVARQEAEARAELGVGSDIVTTVRHVASDIDDVAGLLRLGQELWS